MKLKAESVDRRKKYVIAVSFIALFIIAWEIVSRALISDIFLPPPSEIANVLFADYTVNHLSETLAVLVVGYPISVGLGLVIGFLFVYYRSLYRSIYPVVFSLKAIPATGIAVILVVWLGTGFVTKSILVIYASFFPILVNTVGGLSRIKYEYVEMMRSIQSSKLAIFRKLLFPNALPHLVTGLKSAAPECVIGVAVAELFAGNTGLGYQVIWASGKFNTPAMFAALVWMGIIGMVIFGIIFISEKVAKPWYLRSY